MPDPKCKRVFAALSEFLDGELPARNCRELERHLSDCKPCIAYLETLKTTSKACRQYGEIDVPAPPADLISALRSRVLNLRAKSNRQGPLARRR